MDTAISVILLIYVIVMIAIVRNNNERFESD